MCRPEYIREKNQIGISAYNESGGSMQHIKHKILVMSGKGGVGKTTVAVNLALSFSTKGKSVGLLDADIHGPNVPKLLNLEGKTIKGDGKKLFPVETTQNIKVMSMAFLLPEENAPVIWRGPLKMSAIKQFLEDVYWGELDYLVVDLPPGTGDEPLSVAQLIPEADGVVIVTTPQDVALLDSRKAVNFARRVGLPVIGVIENMSGFVCPHCGRTTMLFKSGGGKRAAMEMRVPFLGAIPIDPDIVTAGDEGKDFIRAHPNAESTKAFKEIVAKIERFVHEKGK